MNPAAIVALALCALMLRYWFEAVVFLLRLQYAMAREPLL